MAALSLIAYRPEKSYNCEMFVKGIDHLLCGRAMEPAAAAAISDYKHLQNAR